MAVFLMVLKTIGLILLSIIAIVILLLLLVLFVPVRYKLKGSYRENIFLDARISYLLHIISVRIIYSEDLALKIKLFGIPIPMRKKKSSDGAETKEEQDKSEEINNKKDLGEKEEKPKKNGIENIKDFLDILTLEETKAAFAVCKRRIGKLFKAVLPRKLNLVIKYGLADPYYTSIVLAIYDVFYTYLGKNIVIYPVYDEKVIDVNGNIKGRVYTIALLWQVIAVILNRNCRTFYKMVRKKMK